MAKAAMFGVIGRLSGRGLSERFQSLEEALEEGLKSDEEDITIPVSSSCIRSIGWRSDGTITVDFIRGGTYSYEGSKELFLAFAAAGSKGEFFNSHFA